MPLIGAIFIFFLLCAVFDENEGLLESILGAILFVFGGGILLVGGAIFLFMRYALQNCTMC